MHGEHWKKYPGNENYWVSDMGRVYNATPRSGGGRPSGLLRYPNNEYSIRFNLPGGYYRIRIVKTPLLVAETWLENPKGFRWAANKNGKKYENQVANVVWCNFNDYMLMMHGKAKESRKHSEESKKSISVGMLGFKHPRVKGHYEIDGVVYESATLAAKALGTYSSMVIRRARDERWSTWVYVPKTAEEQRRPDKTKTFERKPAEGVTKNAESETKESITVQANIQDGVSTVEELSLEPDARESFVGFFKGLGLNVVTTPEKADHEVEDKHRFNMDALLDDKEIEDRNTIDVDYQEEKPLELPEKKVDPMDFM